MVKWIEHIVPYSVLLACSLEGGGVSGRWGQ